MSSLIQLLVCHALAGLGGFFAAHHIDGSTTTGILVGLAMMALGVIISSVSKWFKLDPPQITDNILLRQFLAAVVSQGITALSAYFATDANDPQLLAVAAINMGASKLGAHQKLALLGNKDALKLFLLSAFCSQLCSCTQIKDFIIRNEAVIEEAVIYGARLGVQGGIQKLKRSGKEPREVTPGKMEDEKAESRKADCEEPCGPDAVPRCLKVVAIPDYGTRVASSLR